MASVHIRQATVDDRYQIAAMAQRFLATPPYSDLLGPASPARSLLDFVDLVRERGRIFVAQLGAEGDLVGMLGIVAGEHPVTGQRFAEELAWWVEPAHRGGAIGPMLLAVAEHWARDESCFLLKMVAPDGAAGVAAGLKRRGYQALETAWVKRLAPSATEAA